MGTPLLPWQNLVSDVMGEVDERGRLIHSLGVVTVPRQSGKTTWVLANGVSVCMFRPKAKAWHTAQTGQDAREKFLEMADPFAKSPMGKIAADLKRGAGATRLTFRNDSVFRPHPPTEDALHGQQSDVNNIDEGWSFDDQQGASLIQAIVPTQATRPGAQTIVTSTMGTADSTWFHALCDRGRAGDPGIAYFEWSIPDDADANDLDLVASYHPAYGRLIDMEALKKAHAIMAETPGAFARAYGNRRTASAERVIGVEDWLRAQSNILIPESARPSFAAATSWNRDETAIAAAVQLPDGSILVEVIDVRPGTAWAVSACADASKAADGAPVVVDRVGPSGPLADALALRKLNLVTPSTGEVTTAAADLFDRITNRDENDAPKPRILFRPNQALNEAVDRASKRMIGDGAWTWGRRTSNGSIAALEAATLAAWQAVRIPSPAPAPDFVIA